MWKIQQFRWLEKGESIEKITDWLAKEIEARTNALDKGTLEASSNLHSGLDFVLSRFIHAKEYQTIVNDQRVTEALRKLSGKIKAHAFILPHSEEKNADGSKQKTVIKVRFSMTAQVQATQAVA